MQLRTVSNESFKILFCCVIAAASLGASWPLTVFVAETLKLSSFEIGLAFSACGIGQLLSGLATGKACAKFGKKLTSQFCFLVTALGWLFLLSSSSLNALLIAQFLTGLGLSSFTALSTYYGEFTEPSERTKAFSWVLAFSGLGYLIGPLCIQFSFKSTLTLPLLFLIGLNIFGFVFSFKLPNWELPAQTPKTFLNSLKFSKTCLFLLFSLSCMYISNSVVSYYAPIHIQEISQSSKIMSVAFSLMGVTMMIVPIILYLLDKVISKFNALIIFYSLISVFTLFLGVFEHSYFLLFLFFGWALSWDICNPYLKSLISQNSSPDEQASSLAIQQWIQGASSAVFPALAGLIYGKSAFLLFLLTTFVICFGVFSILKVKNLIKT